MQKINLKSATLSDLGLISTLAGRIWKEHYIPIIGESQVTYMLEKMYAPQNLLEQVQIKNHIFYLISAGAGTIGFLSVHRENQEDWFLNKFYILGETASKGLGTAAFEALIQLIRPKKITLTVNRQNYKSINFYFKNNFKIHHVEDFDIGNGFVMNDFVMTWQVPLK